MDERGTVIVDVLIAGSVTVLNFIKYMCVSNTEFGNKLWVVIESSGLENDIVSIIIRFYLKKEG